MKGETLVEEDWRTDAPQANELELVRQDINRIDNAILDALEERIQLADRVARYKMQHELPILDPRREQSIIESCSARARDAGLPEGTADLFRIIMRMSRERQEQVLISLAADSANGEVIAAYQGVPGANSHLALQSMLGEDIQTRAYETFEGVFAAVEGGEAAYGVLPIENSYTGSVLQVYDLLGRYAVYIVGERSIPIRHSLSVLPGTAMEDIRAVYSHEQALGQCAQFFREHTQIEARPFYNTAGAAQFVAQKKDPTLAALANEHAAATYGLEVLLAEVETSKENETRFLLIAARPYRGRDANKALVRFTLAHTPGSLAQALTHFASYGLNMAKIESRPVHHRNFEYVFYADFEGPGVGPLVRRAIEEDSVLFSDTRILGVYRKDRSS